MYTYLYTQITPAMYIYISVEGYLAESWTRADYISIDVYPAHQSKALISDIYGAINRYKVKDVQSHPKAWKHNLLIS